jgi:hypothetical protein
MLGTQLVWSAEVNQIRKRQLKVSKYLALSLIGERVFAVQAAYPSYDGICMHDLEVRFP